MQSKAVRRGASRAGSAWQGGVKPARGCRRGCPYLCGTRARVICEGNEGGFLCSNSSGQDFDSDTTGERTERAFYLGGTFIF